MIGLFIVLIIEAVINIVMTIALLREKLSDTVAVVLFVTMSWFWMLMTFTLYYENHKKFPTAMDIHQEKSELKDTVQIGDIDHVIHYKK